MTLTIVLFITAAILWCNYVGVPRAIAALMTAQLRARNINIEFSQLRLQGFLHLIARDLSFSSSSSNIFPRLNAASAELFLDYGKLRRGEIDLTGVRLEKGQLEIPIHATNETPRFLSVSNLTTEIDFLAGDTLRINNISAETLGTKARAEVILKNFSKYAQQPAAPPGGDGWERWQRILRDISDLLEPLQFSEPPVLSVRLSGDAADLPGLRGSIGIHAGSASGSGGAFSKLELLAGIYSTKTNGSVAGAFQLNIQGLRSPWGAVAETRVDAETLWSADMEQLMTNVVSVSIADLESRWGAVAAVRARMESTRDGADEAVRTRVAAASSESKIGEYTVGATELEANLRHALPFPTPAAWFRKLLHPGVPERRDSSFSGDWQIRSAGMKMNRASFAAFQLSGGISSSNLAPSADELPDLKGFLVRAQIPWELRASNILSGEIRIGSLMARGNWSWPRFAIAEVDARLYDGILTGAASLDLTTRKGKAIAEGSFDYQEVAKLLDRPVQQWVKQFKWNKPPSIHAQVDFDFPSTAGSWAEIKESVLPTLTLSGQFQGAADFRDISIQNAAGSFHFFNDVWRLTGLNLTRPEGTTVLDYTGNVRNGDFSCHLESRFDPGVLRTLVSEENQDGFDLVRFPEPPLLIGEASGNWNQSSNITFKGRLAATNFFVRGRVISELAGDLAYSNLVLEGWNVRARLGTGVIRAPYVRLDFPAQVMFVTNVVSTADPYNAMFMVGSEAYDAIHPYQFAIPPTVKVNGLVPLKQVSKADLWFEIVGHEFNFWKFNIPSLTGDVHWRGPELWITNVAASFYQGQATWEGYFFIHKKTAEAKGYADYRFHGTATNADLTTLVGDVFGQTNHMEGLFSGDLTIDSANTKSDLSWNGYGTANLRDGFLWSVPVFGVFTPLLDAIVPGSEMSRVTSGQGNFTVVQSVVHTRDLQVKSKAFRLNYKGSVDMQGALNAMVEAEIFRDAWLVGKVFSTVLWPVSKAFEAKISGTVKEPKTQLRFFPRFLLAPFKALGAGLQSNPETTVPETEPKN